MKVRLEPAARAEVSEAVVWYADAAGPTIADKFESAVHNTVSLIIQLPRLGKPGRRSSRSLRINGFPYTLHYRLEGDVIVVLAVAHQLRRPGYWWGR